MHIYRFLSGIARFLARHDKKLEDIIGYFSILTYIPLDYFIFTPNSMAWYYVVPIVLVVSVVTYAVLRIALDLYLYTFDGYVR